MKEPHHKLVLMVLDGWGIGTGDGSDAIAQARTPFMDRAWRSAPHALLLTDGEVIMVLRRSRV